MKDPIIDKIIVEWAHRVHNGMPDPNDGYHLIKLLDRQGEKIQTQHILHLP